MCYLFAVGMSTAPWRLARAFETDAPAELELGQAPAPLCAAFPPRDLVRVVTLRRCSCDLLLARPSTTGRLEASVGLTAVLRRALLRGAAEVGAFRCYVSSGAKASPFEPPLRRVPRAELASTLHVLPLDLLVEVS